MDTSRSAAERVRPILQAMERSIDSARRQRTQTPGTPGHPGAAPMRATAPIIAPAMNHATVGQAIPQPPGHTAGSISPSTPSTRLKAKPKRVGTFASPYDQPVYRSQTG